MRPLLAACLSLALLAGHVEATALQYQPVESAPNAPQGHSSSGSNIVPVVAIASAVIATGYVLFRVHKAKQMRKARLNVYLAQLAQGNK